MKRKSSLRLVRRLGLALAVAAFAAPAAQAMPVISNEGGLPVAPQVHQSVLQDRARIALYADLHAGLPRPVSTTAAPQVLYADDLHASLPRPVSTEPRTEMLTDSLGRPIPADLVQPVSDVVPASTGFDWSDAGIGAVSVFGLMLLGIGVLLVGRHNRRNRLAAI